MRTLAIDEVMKSVVPIGRVVQADRQVDDHHDAELHRVHADGGGERHEHRREQQHRGRQVDEHRRRQHDQVHRQDDQPGRLQHFGGVLGERRRAAARR
jgi:hypothetical protein